MAKDKKSVFVCSNCGFESVKWLGQCPSCGKWNTFEEVVLYSEKQKARSGVVSVGFQSVSGEHLQRIKTGISEFDRVLGGGIVEGEIVLIAGEPGTGKSTLALQVADALSKKGKKVLYITGEESPSQVKLRGKRIGVEGKNIELVPETSVDSLIPFVESSNADVVVVDSIQTLYSERFPSSPGSVVQVREAVARLSSFARASGVPVLMIGHITKEGVVAGPKTVEHTVDAVLYFETDRKGMFRMLRAVKNRFGSTDEIGVFTMTGQGLVEVADVSNFFVEEHEENVSGVVVAPVLEGNRIFLVELQSLVSKTHFGYPRRMTEGVELNRFLMIIAVLERAVRKSLSSFDVYFNVTNGLKIRETAVDLPSVLAVYSSFISVPFPSDTTAFGEIGLTGEIRGVVRSAQRVYEAVRNGFKKIVIPIANYRDLDDSAKNLAEMFPVKNLKEAIELLF